MLQIVRTLVMASAFLTAGLPGDDLRREPLFKIERSKNANIIQYDAQIGPNGRIDADEPVIGYWVRLAEQGQFQELSWIQKQFAFGFDAAYDPESDTVSVELAVDIGRTISVIRDGARYRAVTTIAGSEAYLEKIFIKAHKSGFIITVEHIDLFGKEAETGAEKYERFIP